MQIFDSAELHWQSVPVPAQPQSRTPPQSMSLMQWHPRPPHWQALAGSGSTTATGGTGSERGSPHAGKGAGAGRGMAGSTWRSPSQSSQVIGSPSQNGHSSRPVPSHLGQGISPLTQAARRFQAEC